MKIVFSKQFKTELLNIVNYISQDKKTAALNFKSQLQFKISQLATYPKMYRKSNYADDENIRDLIFKGYTIVYEINEDKIFILSIFKWLDK